jgi:hypothetical protein
MVAGLEFASELHERRDSEIGPMFDARDVRVRHIESLGESSYLN